MRTKSKMFIIMMSLLLSSGIIINNNDSLNNHNNAFALEYSTNAGINFTLKPSISVSLSSSSSSSSTDLVIPDLAPGTSSDSNIITINILSNNSAGYVVNSSVGNDSDYASNLDNLVNTAYSNAKFTNLSYDDAKESLTDDNTWGYAYNSGEGWGSYSGLPLYNDEDHIATLKTTNTPSLSTGDNIAFKIAAKASHTQAAGDYANIINFIVVGNATPVSFYDAFTIAAEQSGSNITTLNGYYKMQDMNAEICNNIQVEHSTMQLIDVRDNNIYTVAKLKDGRCWMTTNLDLPGGTALSADNTNVTEDYINGFSTSNNLTKINNTIVLPASSTSGFDTNNYSYVYNSGNKTDNCASPGCYSYYSWDAATLGSGRSITTDNTDAPYSICPRGWRLPTSRSTVTGNSDFYRLAVAYGMDSSTVAQHTSAFYNNAGPGTTPNFLLAGLYDSGAFGRGESRGYYWSATSSGVSSVYSLLILTGDVTSVGNDPRRYGFSVRCVAGGE